MIRFNSVAQMIANSAKDGDFISTGGYYSDGGSGAATYFVEAPGTTTPDEQGAAFTLANGNIAVLQGDGTAYITQFGGRGKDFFNNDAAFVAAIAYSEDVYIEHSEDSVYGIESPIEINARTALRGAAGKCWVKCNTLNQDALIVSPDNPELGETITSCEVSGILFFSDLVNVSGVGARLYQVNNLNMKDTAFQGFNTGVEIQGINLSKFENVRVFPGNLTSGNACVSIDGYPLSGGGYSPSFTTDFNNCVFSGEQVYDYDINIIESDGLNFTDCYVAQGVLSAVNLAPLRDDTLVGVVGFTACYFDAVSTSQTFLKIPDNSAYTGSAINDVRFVNCKAGGQQGDCVVIEGDVIGLIFDGGYYKNIQSSFIKKTGSNQCYLTVSDCNIQDAAKGADNLGIIDIDSAASLSITGNTFINGNRPGTDGVRLSGTVVTAVVSINNFSFITNEINNTSTATNRAQGYSQIGNVSTSGAITDI